MFAFAHWFFEFLKFCTLFTFWKFLFSNLGSDKTTLFSLAFEALFHFDHLLSRLKI